jgi:hypothetical protein
MQNQISAFFTGIAAKRLSSVEVRPDSSNQHEFNGISKLKDIFGSEKICFQGVFLSVSDDEKEFLEDTGSLTWYDAREKHPSRTEYRLYYSTNEVIKTALPGDLIIICRQNETKLAIIVAPRGSTIESQLLWLFGLNEVGTSFVVKDLATKEIELGFAGRFILRSLGIEVSEVEHDYLDEILTRFNNNFPATFVFSEYARSTIPYLNPVEEPDETLLACLEREEMLFKTLESHLVSKKLEVGFGAQGKNVDDFISYSLSIQNRRKARAGYAFENHLAYIFDSHKIWYTRGAKTERNNKPDFLFPSAAHYRDELFSGNLLTMLGLKTTAKDRWRQILAEAERIPTKHLITLEPAISKNQTDEMKAQNLQLVLPDPILNTYSLEQREDLINLSQFISLVNAKQRKLS